MKTPIIKRANTRPARPIYDITGERCGNLLAIKFIGVHPTSKNAMWECLCDCGTITTATGTDFRKRHKLSCGCRRKRGRKKGEAARNAVFRGYQRGAQSRNLEWSIPEEHFNTLVKLDCYFCGSKPENLCDISGYNGSYTYNGIDRLDNRKGYTVENSVPCCITCNRSKHKKDVEYFLKWVEKVYNHSIAKEPNELIGLRKRIHFLEHHNQYFERCESAWCHPTINDNPAQGIMLGMNVGQQA